MTRIALQALQVATFAAIALVTHAYVSRRRDVFLKALEELAGPSVRTLVAVFALLVAAAQVAGLVVLHRVAHHLEPWPPSTATLAEAA